MLQYFFPNKVNELYDAIMRLDVEQVKSITNSYFTCPSFKELCKDHDESSLWSYAARNEEIFWHLIAIYNKDIDKNLTFLKAIKHSYVEIIELFLEQYNDEISLDLKKTAFATGVKNDWGEVVRLVLDRCDSEIEYAALKMSAFICAAKRGCVNVFRILLEQFCEVNDGFLIFLALEEAEKNNQEEIIEILHERFPDMAALEERLLEEEANESAMAPLSQTEKNFLEDLKLKYESIYQAKGGWEAIRLEILDYLKKKYDESPVKEGYQRVWMLPPDSKIPDTFVPADTIGLHRIGETCTVSWKDAKGKLCQKDIEWAKVAFLYKDLSKQNYLYQDSQDQELVANVIKAFKIPAYPNQDTPLLPLDFNKLTPAARVAHFRHVMSNAYRYLSDYNLLMHKDAAFVVVNGDRKRADYDDEAKQIIAFFWIALNDVTLKLDDGFTVERILDGFAGVIQSLNRGHNRDQRALYPDEKIPTTCMDDLKEDKPTCKWGVKKQLFQAVYGHPVTRPLSVKILRDYMEERLIKTHFFPRLDRLSVEDLKYIVDQIEDYELSCLEGMESALIGMLKGFLPIPEKLQDDFMNEVKAYFSGDRIERKRETKITDNLMQQSYDNYQAMIEDFVQNPLNAFAGEIRVYACKKIAELTANSDPVAKRTRSHFVAYKNESDKKRKDESSTRRRISTP